MDVECMHVDGCGWMDVDGWIHQAIISYPYLGVSWFARP